MSVIIRPVSHEETEQLRSLAEYTFRIAWEHMNDPADFETYCRENFTADGFESAMNTEDARFFFATENDSLIGYFKLNYGRLQADWPEKESAVQLERIYVVPGQQGKGIGKQMLDFTEKEAIRTGHSWVWLSVWQAAPRSIQFYEKNGYQIFGTEVFQVGSDAQLDWVMKKRIA